jgi:hypothetical protein
MYDLKCDGCERVDIDVLEPVSAPRRTCECGGTLWRTWATKPPAAIGDECDVTIEHGLCHENGTPRRFTSKSEIARAAKAAGLMNYVRHVGERGSDKSPMTSRWI